MNVGDFAPYGRFNQQPQAQGAGGLGGQQQAQQASGSGALSPGGDPQLAPAQQGLPPWVEGMPQGMMTMLQRAPQVGFGRAFLDQYGSKFENIDAAHNLVGALSASDQAMGYPGMGVQGDPGAMELTDAEEDEDDTLDYDSDPFFEEAEAGAFWQANDHIGLGGLY